MWYIQQLIRTPNYRKLASTLSLSASVSGSGEASTKLWKVANQCVNSLKAAGESGLALNFSGYKCFTNANTFVNKIVVQVNNVFIHNIGFNQQKKHNKSSCRTCHQLTETRLPTVGKFSYRIVKTGNNISLSFGETFIAAEKLAKEVFNIEIKILRHTKTNNSFQSSNSLC